MAIPGVNAPTCKPGSEAGCVDVANNNLACIYPQTPCPVPTAQHVSLFHQDISSDGLCSHGPYASSTVRSRFAQAGASSVTIIGRRTSQLDKTKSRIEQAVSGADVYTYSADITNGDAVSAAFKAIHEAVGDIHVLICNAGYISEPGPIKDADAEEWWTAFQVNIKGAFLTAQAFLHHKAADAVVIYITSALSHVDAGPFKSSYVSSKAGAVRFFNALQLEHPELRVISLHPGTVETQMLKKAGHAAGVDDESLPAGTIVWLASPEADFLKGKYVWANWDVEEMKARAEEISRSDLLTIKLGGWPFEKNSS